MKEKNRLLLFIIFMLSFQSIVVCQTIIEEGKGIDSLTIGIKETKVIKFLGENYKRKEYHDKKYVLEYKKELINLVFDKDSVLEKIDISIGKHNYKTKKGLRVEKKTTITEIEKIYGEDWGGISNNQQIYYDIGIGFIFKKNYLKEVVIEKGDDYSFYEYIEGIYIPKDLEDCYKELDKMLERM